MVSSYRSMIVDQIDQVRLALNTGDPYAIQNSLLGLDTLIKSIISGYQKKPVKERSKEEQLLIDTYNIIKNDFKDATSMRISRTSQAQLKIMAYHNFYGILCDIAIYSGILGADETSRTKEIWKE